MKVLHLISPNGFFGAEKLMCELTKKLYSSGYNPYIGIIGNSLNSLFALTNELEKNNLQVRVFHCNGKLDMGVIFEIRQFIKANKIDIIHSHGYKSNFYGLLASLGMDKKRIATCHNWLSNSKKMKFYEYLDRLLLKRFDKVVAVSDVIRDKVLRGGVSEDRVIVINNGVDVERFRLQTTDYRLQTKKSLGIREDEMVIGTVGRLTSEKGHIYLLKAFAKVISEFPDVKLLIVGDGPLKNSLQSMVDSLQLNDKVIFTGIRNDIPEILSIMDVFVLPSLKEGMPMALLEALAAKKPVIATRVGAISKIIDNGKTGLLVEIKDVNGVYNSILRILKDREKANLLAENGYQKVKNNFSAKKMAEEYISIYKSH